MKVAVLSGKGGAGKTLVATGLACVAGRAVYIDCDVDVYKRQAPARPAPPRR